MATRNNRSAAVLVVRIQLHKRGAVFFSRSLLYHFFSSRSPEVSAAARTRPRTHAPQRRFLQGARR